MIEVIEGPGGEAVLGVGEAGCEGGYFLAGEAAEFLGDFRNGDSWSGLDVGEVGGAEACAVEGG